MGRRQMRERYRRDGCTVILDGGMGHLLRRNGVEISGPIGTMERFLGVALANRDQPDLVLESHLQFLRAGADVITTNTYACVPAAVASRGDAPEELVVELIEAGGRVARQAQEIAVAQGLTNAPPLVAGCLPPLHETYRADRVAEYPELAATYRVIVEAVAPYSDVLLCETMHSIEEGYAAAEAANRAGLPVWVSFTVAEDGSGHLRSGETIAEGIAALSEFENVEAVLLNCSSAGAIAAAIPRMAESASDLRFGAYANGFSKEFLGSVGSAGNSDDEATYSEYDDDLTPAQYARVAEGWLQQGASIIGGCCGVFPEHIEAVSAQGTALRS